MNGLFAGDASVAIEDLHAATAIYTDRSVARAMLVEAGWPRAGMTLLDPGCGDGSFLCEAIRMLSPPPGDMGCAGLLNAWEVHPGAAGEARGAAAKALVACGWEAHDAADAAGRMVIQQDFVTGARAGRHHDLIIGNPPFLRWAHVPKSLRDLYEGSVPSHARGDIAHAFLDIAADLVSDAGTVALITADRWLMNSTGSAMRASVGRRLSLESIGRLDPATSFHRPKHRRTGAPPRVHPVKVVMRRPGTRQGLRPITSDPLCPDGFLDEHEGPRLGDVARVRLAPWLGPKGIFTVDARGAAALPGADLVPVVDAGDIDGRTGTLKPGPRRFAIRTKPGEEPPEPVLQHLDATLSAMPPRGRREPRWLPPERMPEPEASETLLIPRIIRVLRTTRLPPGMQPIDHGLHVIADGAWSLERIERALEDPRCARWFEAHAPRLENGFHSLTTTVLRRMPVHEPLRDP